MSEIYKVIGGHESYFTGKLEAYLRAKGIPYENIPFTMEKLQEVAAHTGFVQIPQVECPDGSWLVDTTMMIEYLDRLYPEPVTAPADSAANFIALLLEDYADEWLWRPAMHYRWSYPNSAELMSSWLAEHMPQSDANPADNKAFFYQRQLGTFVEGDGVTSDTREAVESSYFHALDSLEAIFAQRDFILGDRPTQADFGFMGPMFRHFFCDPDPARIMRERAPGVQEWVARMWNMNPQRFTAAAQIEAIPGDLEQLLAPVTAVYLPYLLANQHAVIAGQEQVSYEALGVVWDEPTKPFRLWCLDRLREHYQQLGEQDRQRIAAVLADPTAVGILTMPVTGHSDHLMGALPYRGPVGERKIYSSWGGEAG